MRLPDPLVITAVEWLATYALHSSLLLGLVAIGTSAWIRDEAFREMLWRGALVGPVLTASLATTLPVGILAGRVQLDLGRVPVAQIAPAIETARPGGNSPPAPSTEIPPWTENPAGSVIDDRWAHGSIAAWAGIASLFLMLLAVRNAAFFHGLRDRERIEGGPLVAMLEQLCRRVDVPRRVRLSVSARCATPMVIARSEICLPPRFLELDDRDLQRAALAHEVAHIRRRDPQWELTAGVLSATLFLQPLNLLARHKLRESAEFLSDDWAIRHTGSAVALGRCLKEVASWSAAAPLPNLSGTPALAESGSPLVRRMRRIADEATRRVGVRRVWLRIAVVPILGAVSIGAPAIDARSGSSSAVTPPDSAKVAFLEELAMSDALPRIRQEAAAELSDVGGEAASRALIRLLEQAPDSFVRAEAAQQLDEFPTDEVVDALQRAVFADPVVDVRRNALDVLDDFSIPSAISALRTISRDHPGAGVRSDALSALSDTD